MYNLIERNPCSTLLKAVEKKTIICLIISLVLEKCKTQTSTDDNKIDMALSQQVIKWVIKASHKHPQLIFPNWYISDPDENDQGRPGV